MLSIVIPTWSGTPELRNMATNLIDQVRPMCDELIICEDGGEFGGWSEADLYLYHPNIGDVPNSVLGILAASGDYIAVINSDVIIHRGSVRDLCIPGKVVSPCWRELREYTGFQGPFFVIDRTIFPKYGYPDPSRAVGCDYEYAGRIKDIYEWCDKLEYTHLAGRSYSEKRRLFEKAERGEA